MQEAFSVGSIYSSTCHTLLTSQLGEDALANLSIEKEGEDGPITGFVRIRSRSQGLALSLGSLKGLNKIGSTS
jgi:coatomer subunit beta